MTDTNTLQLSGIPTPRAAGEIQISALPEASTPINENDITNIKQGVEDKKVTVRDLLAPHASRTGNVHNMTPADLGLGQLSNYPITDAVDDKNSQKYASAMAVALVSERIDKMHPVGDIILSMNSANPSTYGYVGTWELAGKGRTLVGFDPANAQRPVGTEFGAENINIGVNNLPAHTVRLTGTVAAAGDHNHSININTTGAGQHTHNVNAQTTAAGDHAHGVHIGTTAEGNHSHSFSGNTSVAGQHNHGAPVEAVWNDYPQAIVPASYWGGGRGTFWNSRSSTSTDGNHSHSVSGGTSNAGQHTHIVSGNTNGVGAHQHTLNTTTSQVEAHIHNVSGNTAQSGQHTHQIDLTSQSVGGGQSISVAQLSLVTYIWTRTA